MFNKVSGQSMDIYFAQWISAVGLGNIWEISYVLGQTEVVPFCWCTSPVLFAGLAFL